MHKLIKIWTLNREAGQSPYYQSESCLSGRTEVMSNHPQSVIESFFLLEGIGEVQLVLYVFLSGYKCWLREFFIEA